MEGMTDWTKFTIKQHIEHLEEKFKYDSSGTAKSVFELIAKYRALTIPVVSGSLFNEALKLMRDLAEHQNGAPLIQHEEDYNKTMTEVWNFLDANET